MGYGQHWNTPSLWGLQGRLSAMDGEDETQADSMELQWTPLRIALLRGCPGHAYVFP